jgi:hypothetical protein
MEKKIIISLTTIPSRIKYLEPVIESLLDQNIIPDMIYLNIPKKYKRFNEEIVIPDFIYKYQKLNIYQVDKDYGPATKFIGSLQNPEIKNNDLIVVTDDDIIKKSCWLEKLIDCHQPNKVCGFVEKRLGQSIIWGYLGYLFKKSLFDVDDIINFYENVKDDCYLVDDHWFTGYCHYRKIKIYNISISYNSVINKKLLKGKDSLVALPGDNNRRKVSEKCRNCIYKKYHSKFPFWCCIGCCPSRFRYIESFTNTKKNNNLVYLMALIISIFSLYNKYYISVISSIILLTLYKYNKYNKYNNIENFYNTPNEIPKIIVQTYKNKNVIPSKVYNNIKKFAPNYKHIIFDDLECIDFLNKYYEKKIVYTFNKLKGAHKADLFRYCFLYKYGGVYLDIKTEILKPINQTFCKNYTYSVLSIINDSVYQGIIATPPKNKIFLKLINFMVKLVDSELKYPYIVFTVDFFEKIKFECEKKPICGLNKGYKNNNYYLLRERCSRNKNNCYDGLDWRGFCCYIYDGNEKVFKGRYSDYPW